MKLNLGCGKDVLDGYVNVDREDGPGVDVVADVRKMTYPDGSADEILASHILEHFELEAVPAVLAEWRRILVPEHSLFVAVPDFLRLAEILLSTGNLPVNVIYGQASDPHRSGFTEPILTALLYDAGFRSVYKVAPFGGPGAGTRAVVSGINVSLNMRAVK